MSILALALSAAAFASVNYQQVDQNRLQIIKRGATDAGLKMSREGGLAELFIGPGLETSLTNLEARGLARGRVRKQPWSGHAWPNVQGGLGFRWADGSFPEDFGSAYNHVRRYTWNRTPWNYLSPAEKYDHLTGVRPDERGSLTSHQWNLGLEEYRRTGRVAEWQGICHGWSPASIYLPTPAHDVIFKFPEGDLYFTVEDIKAVGSLYWANGKYESVFAGWRCNEATPATNAEGRVLDPKCFDVNPADWHLALTNIVGARREAFIMDAAETSEVWNHPVTAYSLQYWDPTNFNVRSSDFRRHVRAIARTPNLRHRQYRSSEAVYVVGVVSTVNVAIESNPGDRRNLEKEMSFVYDLELDANYRVVGGEWRNNTRPDFLWRRKDQQVPQAVGQDVQLDMWRMGDATWRRASLENSAQGVPLKFFVEKLFQMSAGQE